MTATRPVHIGAVDLGASSGRVMVGTLADGRIDLTQTRRFTNGAIPLPTREGERLFWDMLHLWNEVREGLLTAVRDVGPLSAIGIDTWGVDYGLVNGSGTLSAQVHAYRSERTRGIPERVFAKIPASEIYAINGLQVQEFNTMFQLVAQARDNGIPRTSNGAYARTLLLLPDLLACFLTGQRVAEVTNASTTGLVDARLRAWSRPLLERLRTELGLDLDGVLPDIVEPGTLIGPVRRESLEVFGPDGSPTPVIAVGSHDTASAVVAVPAAGADFAYISCGTWSLVGLELDEPVLTLASQAANFTNELGVDHTVRYLKNIMGLWVLNEAVRTWQRQGMEISLPELDAAAAAGVRHVVYTSFLGAAPDAVFTLARTHWATEEHLRASGVGLTLLRDSFYADFLPELAVDGVIAGPAGQGRVGAVARADVARAATAVIGDLVAGDRRHDGAVYELTGPQALSLSGVAAALTAAGRPTVYRQESVEEAYASRSVYGAPDWQVDAWVSTYTAIASGALDRVTDDVERLTGRQPLSLAQLLAGHH